MNVLYKINNEMWVNMEETKLSIFLAFLYKIISWETLIWAKS